MTAGPQRIDVHHHLLPPEYVARMNATGLAWTGGPHVPAWSPALARETMSRHGISSAVASVSPGVHWGDDASAARLARICNEYLARLVQDDAARFGGFATLPLPDAAAALREMEYALDVLELDGVILFSSAGGRYPGDPAYEELFAELDRRRAIVFVHPNTIPPGADATGLDIPYGVIEFTFDTTRAITNLLYRGVLERYPSIRYIVSHAGGTVPYLAWRIAGAVSVPGVADRATAGDAASAMRALASLYYDTALSTSECALAALREFTAPSHVLFGSDFPYVPDALIRAETSGIEASRVLDDASKAAIARDNALALFPRFARA